MSRASSEIKSQPKKVLSLDTMRGYAIDSEDDNDPLQLVKLDDFSCGANASLVEKVKNYLIFIKGACCFNYDCFVICCNDDVLKIKAEIKEICAKLFPNTDTYIIGSRAPLFTYWFSHLKLKPNFGELVAISRIKSSDPSKQGMVCGLFTRYRDGDKEYLAQIDGINTEKNDFHELAAKIKNQMSKYSSRNTNVKVIYVAVYPIDYEFVEDKTKPLLVKSYHFPHQDTDRAKGALEFGKNKVNENLENYIEIKEQQDQTVKVMKESPVPSSVSSKSTTTQNAENRHSQFYQQQLYNKKFIVGIDIGTTSCRAAVMYKNGNGKEMCEKVSLKGTNDKMPSIVNFDENQTYKGCEVVKKNNGDIDAKISENNTLFDIIRFMGKSIDEVNIHSILPFKIEENRDFVKIKLNIGSVLPEVACGELLKFIAQEADEKLKSKVTHVTLTTPVFNDQDSKNKYETSLKCAAQLASLNIVQFIDAPTAALIDFIFKYKKSTISNYNVCVIDIGGGSADIVAYNVETDMEGFCLKPILKYGNSKFCGRNFDVALAEKIKSTIEGKEGHTVNIGSNFALLSRAEQMKIKLSTESSANYIYDNGSATISSTEFQKCILPFIESFKTHLAKINNRMEEKGQNSEVLIIGSTCKIPIVSKTIKNAFPNSNVVEALFYGVNISFAQGVALHTAKLQKSNDQISFYKY